MAPLRLRSEIWLILCSIFIAFVLWLVAKQGALDNEWVTIPVQLENPFDNMAVQADQPDVSINVRYSKQMSNKIVPMNFSLHIDTKAIFGNDPDLWPSPLLPMDKDYKLDVRDVQTDLPQKLVTVIGIDTKQIRLTAQLHTALVQVGVVTTGSLAADLELTAPPRPEIEQFLVTGSPEALESLPPSLPTEPVDLAALRSSGQVFRRVLLPGGITPLKPRDGRIAIDIGLKERIIEKLFGPIPVSLVAFNEKLEIKVTPAVAEVKVQGPSSALSVISPDDFVFSTTKVLEEVPDKPQEVGIVAQLKKRVPVEIQSQITILECRPPRIRVEFVPAVGENTGAVEP